MNTQNKHENTGDYFSQFDVILALNSKFIEKLRGLQDELQDCAAQICNLENKLSDYNKRLYNSQKSNLAFDAALLAIRPSTISFLCRLMHYFLPYFTNDTRRELKSFIATCQRQVPRLVPLPTKDKGIDVSIIVPVYNQWKLTQACLNSILKTCDNSINYELILADDCSTDTTIVAGEYYPGLIIVKTDKNVGFLKNCNHAAKKARGRYILLLNNDTIVLPNWLSSLYNTLERDLTAAISGSKMLHANGTIQEAGAVIFSDGTAYRIGYGFDRYFPIFNLERETHYVSGCSILIRKSFWEAVGGFDEQYQVAYYEDSDLAMMARLRGMRVIYQPASEVVHFSSQSYKKRASFWGKKNANLFSKKWMESPIND